MSDIKTNNIRELRRRLPRYEKGVSRPRDRAKSRIVNGKFDKMTVRVSSSDISIRTIYQLKKLRELINRTLNEVEG